MNNGQVLVLNASYEALGFVPWERAITLFYEEKIDVIESYPDKILHSAYKEMYMPAVVRFKRWVAPRKKVVRFSRENLYLRDGGKCQYCGLKVKRSEMTYDHVTPRSQGGQTTWTNLATCCVKCNQHKGGRTPEKAGMRLLSVPQKPDRLPDALSPALAYRPGMPEQWKEYLRDIATFDEYAA